MSAAAYLPTRSSWAAALSSPRRSGEIFAIDTASNQSKLLVNLDSEVDGPLTAYEDVIYVHLHDMTLQRVNASNGALLRPISLKSS